ncbi:MAG: hypothetical protein NZM33_17265 [Bryobacteraceae bacterium]|nr:hypothetical protein [Bryobacteraceae bacterium]
MVCTSYVLRLRDRVVLPKTIRAGVAELHPPFGNAESYDETTEQYRTIV